MTDMITHLKRAAVVVSTTMQEPMSHRRLQAYILTAFSMIVIIWITIFGHDTQLHRDIIYYAFWTLIVVNGLYTAQHKFADKA